MSSKDEPRATKSPTLANQRAPGSGSLGSALACNALRVGSATWSKTMVRSGSGTSRPAMMSRHRSEALYKGDVMVVAADWVGEARGADVGSIEHPVAARTRAAAKRARRIRNL